MALYRLFAGLSGGFGGAQYHGTYEYDTYEEAERDARTLAREEYESYEGYHGIMSWSDVLEDLRESGYIEDDMTEGEIEQMVDDSYAEQVESWIVAYVKPAEEGVVYDEMGDEEECEDDDDADCWSE